MAFFNSEFLTDIQIRFLDVYSTGGNIQRALNSVKVSRAQFREWQTDNDFTDALEDAYQSAIDMAEEELRRRALGWEEPVYFKGQPVYKRDPETGEYLLDENMERIPFTTAKYSDKLLEVYVKAHKPIYKDKTAVELTGKDGGAIESVVTVEYVLPSGKTVDDYGDQS